MTSGDAILPDSKVADTSSVQRYASLPGDHVGCDAAWRGGGSGDIMWSLVGITAAVVAVGMNVQIATADTIQSFSIFGTGTTFNDGPFSFSGDMSIDITTHTLASLNIGFTAAAALQPTVDNTFEAYVCGGFTGCPLQGFGTAIISMTPDQANDGLYSGGFLVGGLIPIGTATASECRFYPEPCFEQITGYSGDVTPATPLPAALPLFATALGIMGLLGWHKKRKNEVVPVIRTEFPFR